MGSKQGFPKSAPQDSTWEPESPFGGETLSGDAQLRIAVEDGFESPFTSFQPAPPRHTVKQFEEFETSAYHESLLSTFVDTTRASGEEEWEGAAALEAKSPFRHAFEQGQTGLMEPEGLEEELHDEQPPYVDAEAEAEEEEDSYREDARSLEEESFIPEEAWTETQEEEVAYPPEETAYAEEEPFLDEETLIESEEFLRLFNPGAIVQRARQLLGEGAFSLSLFGHFASGQIWNEDYLALEILFHRQSKLRPTRLDKVFGLERLRLLGSLAMKHRRELAPIREGIVRPIFGNPANFQVGPAGECQIQDLRKEVRDLGPLEGGKNKDGTPWYKRDKKRSPREREKIDSIVLHHMAFNRGNLVKLYKKVCAQYIVTADGQIAQLYDDLDFLNASNDFNRRCISIEFAGNFPDHRYDWWKGGKLHISDRCYLTPAQIRAGRCLLATLKARLPGIKYLYAHRQSSKTRANDPGPDVWFNIAEWALTKLNLTDRLPQTHVGTGQPIPEIWRMSRPAIPAMTVTPTPQPTSGEEEAPYAEGESQKRGRESF